MIQHLSIRVPWTDNGFIGRVCDCPLKNFACQRLKSIAENSMLACHQPEVESVGFSCFSEKDKRQKLPCITESKAFMSQEEITVECSHDYSKYYSTHKDFVPSTMRIPPYTLVARPFRWLMRGDNISRSGGNVIRALNNIPDRDPSIAHLLTLEDRGKTVGESWVQHHASQKQVFETFFENVIPGKSLCFIYAKSVPYVEDADRILLGVAVVDKTVQLPQMHKKIEGSQSKLESFSWECMVQHKIRKSGYRFLSDEHGVFGGFILPYDQFIQKIEDPTLSNREKEELIKDFQKVVVSIPSDFREEFSYASEHVSDDVAISVLMQLKKSLEDISKIDYIQGNVIDCRVWIDAKIEELWASKSVYPSLGMMLSAVLDSDNGCFPGMFIANELDKHMKTVQNADVFDMLSDWIENGESPSGIEFTRNHRLIWQKAVTENNDSYSTFKKLSRISLSLRQADFLWRKFQRGDLDISDNPYKIYSACINEDEALRVPLSKVDSAFFVPRTYRKRFFGDSKDYIESADDPYRVTGFALKALSDAATDGHTYLPIDKMIERIQDVPVCQECHVEESVLRLYDSEYFNDLIKIIDNSQGRFYKLKYYDVLDSCIRKCINDRLSLPAMPFDAQNFSVALPEGIVRNADADKEQQEAAEAISKSAISVLCGPAGTGKTTLLTNLCKLFDNRVLLLAPTGKARVRMQQNMVLNIPHEVKTVAGYLIKLDSVESGKKSYDYFTGRYFMPKEQDHSYDGADVIVDESSMLTEEMFAALLVALQGARRIMFVGDVSQLPPIGAGKPFYELCQLLESKGWGFGKLKTQTRFYQPGQQTPLDVELSKHFALDEDIKSAANDEVFKLLSGTEKTDRLSFVEWDNPKDLREKLLDVLRVELDLKSNDDVIGFNKSLGATEYEGKQYFWCGNEFEDFQGRRVSRDGIGSFADDWQIIMPLRNRYDIGSVGINAFVQEHYRSEAIRAELELRNKDWRFPLPYPGNIVRGDKVINLANTNIETANKPIDADKIRAIPVANGEIGVVGQAKSFKKIKYGVEFSSQPRKCFCYSGKEQSDDSSLLELAYAITVHKAQGSDFKTVILIMGENTPLTSREMLYTALTRQKHRLVIMYNGSIESLKDLKLDSKSALLNRYSDLFFDAHNINLDDALAVGRSNYIHRTDRGERVISKSEVIVANALARLGINYVYEKPLHLSGYAKAIKPDFTITHNGNVFYWEHLGMMSQADYAYKWQAKLELYRKNGIEPIVSQDDTNGGIDSKEIERIIRDKILNA